MLLGKRIAAVGAAMSRHTGYGTDCPDTTTSLTCSQAGNPKSAHHGDQTELDSRKHWVSERYCEKDVLASPSPEVARVSRR